MKRNLFLLTLFISILLTSSSVFAQKKIKGNGKIEAIDHDVKNFTEVEFL